MRKRRRKRRRRMRRSCNEQLISVLTLYRNGAQERRESGRERRKVCEWTQRECAVPKSCCAVKGEAALRGLIEEEVEEEEEEEEVEEREVRGGVP